MLRMLSSVENTLQRAVRTFRTAAATGSRAGWSILGQEHLRECCREGATRGRERAVRMSRRHDAIALDFPVASQRLVVKLRRAVFPNFILPALVPKVSPLPAMFVRCLLDRLVCSSLFPPLLTRIFGHSSSTSQLRRAQKTSAAAKPPISPSVGLRRGL